MKKRILNYINLPYEQKLILKTVVGMLFSAALAVGKLIIGLFGDYALCGTAAYSLAMLAAKLECVIGTRTQTKSFAHRNRMVAVFLMISSVCYTVFMSRLLFTERVPTEYPLEYVVILAFISFVEFGFALSGLIRTKDKGHFYRNIKIVNFGLAMIAILTTQITLLDFTQTPSADGFNGCAGIGIGIFLAICAVYVYFAPRISVVGREYNEFRLCFVAQNKLIRTSDTGQSVELMLCKSYVYGSYVYRARLEGETLRGNIERQPSLWKRMPVAVKILCIVLSEILMFVWLGGRLIYFFRTIDLPGRLERILQKQGFERVEAGASATEF